jgi:hypothetical protein
MKVERGVGIQTCKLMGGSMYDSLVLSETDNFLLPSPFSLLPFPSTCRCQFNCAVRQSITQDVPLVNTSDSVMVVQAKVDGKSYSGISEVRGAGHQMRGAAVR